MLSLALRIGVLALLFVSACHYVDGGRPFGDAESSKKFTRHAGFMSAVRNDMNSGFKAVAKLWKDGVLPGLLRKDGKNPWEHVAKQTRRMVMDDDDEYENENKQILDEQHRKAAEYAELKWREEQDMKDMEEVIARGDPDGDLPTLEEVRQARAERREWLHRAARQARREQEAAELADVRDLWGSAAATEVAQELEEERVYETLEDEETLPSFGSFRSSRSQFFKDAQDAASGGGTDGGGGTTATDKCKPGKTVEYPDNFPYCDGKRVSEEDYDPDNPNCELRVETRKECLCPVDFHGPTCNLARPFSCRFVPDPPLPDACLAFEENENMDHLLSGDPPCLWYSYKDTFSFKLYMDCKYDVPVTQEEMSNLIFLGAFDTLFAKDFEYWLVADDLSLVLTKDPRVNLRFKAFNFVHIGDESQTVNVFLNKDRWTGKTPVIFTRNLTKMVEDRGFAAGGRTYFEIGFPFWHNQHGLRNPAPLRQFLDYTDLPPIEDSSDFWTHSEYDITPTQLLFLVTVCIGSMFLAFYIVYKLSGRSQSRIKTD